MRLQNHLLAIAAGIGAPLALTLWITSDYGPRSKAHYAEINAEITAPREVVENFLRIAVDEQKPDQAMARFANPTVFAANATAWSTQAAPRTFITEGDQVVVQSGGQVVDIFQVAQGKIIAHSHFVQSPAL